LHRLAVSLLPTTYIQPLPGIIASVIRPPVPVFATLVFDAHHADYLVRLFSENLSNGELAAQMSKQFRVRITAAQVGTLLTRMRRPTDALYRAVPYRRAGSRFSS
jgi:hypothetical protein